MRDRGKTGSRGGAEESCTTLTKDTKNYVSVCFLPLNYPPPTPQDRPALVDEKDTLLYTTLLLHVTVWGIPLRLSVTLPPSVSSHKMTLITLKSPVLSSRKKHFAFRVKMNECVTVCVRVCCRYVNRDSTYVSAIVASQ